MCPEINTTYSVTLPLQLAKVMLSQFLTKTQTEIDIFGTYLDIAVLQGLRIELAAIQNSWKEDYLAALDSIAAVRPYFPPDHFINRIRDLLIWRRPLLTFSDENVSIKYSVNREDITSDMEDFPEAFYPVIVEHIDSYFEEIYDLLDTFDELNQDHWSGLHNTLSLFSDVMNTYVVASQLDEHYIILYIDIRKLVIFKLGQTYND